MMNETLDGLGGGDDSSTVEEEIAALAVLITQARELVATGHTIDLSGLGDKVGAFCADVVANPPDDPESVKAMLEALVKDLTALGHEMAMLEQGGADGHGGVA